MRMLFLSTWFPYPPDNGSRIRAFYLVRALAGVHQVTVVGLRSAEDGRDPVFSPEWSGKVVVHSVPVDAFHAVSLPQLAKFVSPIPVAYRSSRDARQAIAQVANLSQWDVVVAFQSPVARYALGIQGVPRVLDIDTALSYQMRSRYRGEHFPAARLRSWLSWQKAQQYERHLFRRFGACTVSSPKELPHVRTMVGCRGHLQVVPNGVDCARNRPGLAEVVPDTMVWNGALTYSANYDAMRYFLSEIYPAIRQEVPGVSLTITGSTAGVDLAGLQLSEGVHLSGYVDDIRQVVARASVCVVPLRQGGGTRLKILEAMALGTPIVATSKGAEGLDVSHERDILVADQPTEFAAQVVRLLRDQDLRQRLAKDARSRVEERYDWAQIGEGFVALVERTGRENKGKRVHR